MEFPTGRAQQRMLFCLLEHKTWEGWKEEVSASSTVTLATVAHSLGQKVILCHNIIQLKRKRKKTWAAFKSSEGQLGRFHVNAQRV